VDTQAGKGIEIHRQGGDEGFTFTGLHLRDHAAVKSGASDELNIKMDHLPHQRVVIHHDFPAAQAAGTVFNDSVGFRKDLLQVFGAGLDEIQFDGMEGILCLFNRFRSGLHAGRQGGEFLAQQCKTGFHRIRRFAKGSGIHPQDRRLRWSFQGVITGKVGLPLGRQLTELFLRFALQRFFDIVDAGYCWPNTTNFPLVFVTYDFLEDPLDHESDWVRRFESAGREGIHRYLRWCKTGNIRLFEFKW